MRGIEHGFGHDGQSGRFDAQNLQIVPCGVKYIIAKYFQEQNWNIGRMTLYVDNPAPARDRPVGRWGERIGSA
jgi:hypothetical protein